MKDMFGPAQLRAMAKQLKAAQGAQQEAQALDQLAQTGLDDSQQTQLRGMLADKDKLKQLLSSPQAQALMRKLGGNNDGNNDGN